MRGFRRVGFLAAAAAVAAILSSGCANSLVSGTIERRMKEKLPELLGPADSYELEVSGGTVPMTRGRIDELVIRGRGVQVMPDFQVDELIVRITDLVAASDGAIKSVGGVTFEALATQARLNDYLVRSKQKEMTIELLEDRLLVNARPRLLGIPASVRVTGPLLPDGAKLNLKIESLEVIGVGVPSIAADFVEWKVNPVVDMATTGFAPHLRAVEISPQGIRIRGAANIAAALEGSDSR